MADRHRDDEPLIPASGPAPDALSADTPAPGLIVRQPRRGYRWGVEVYLLADFALRGGVPATALDLGCGSGVIGLLLASQGVAVTLVEREPSWAPLLTRSIADSGRGTALFQDVRTLGPEVCAELVVSNPPWFSPDEPIPPDPWKAAARAMLHGDVDEFVAAGLRAAPRVCLVTRRVVVAPDGAHVARVARHGDKLSFTELRRGDGPCAEEPIDVDAAYRRFRG